MRVGNFYLNSWICNQEKTRMPLSRSLITLVFLVIFTPGLSGCFGGVTQNFSQALVDSDDPDTVRDALPAYLLMIDALLKDSDSPDLFWSGAKLSGTYASQFSANNQQKVRLANKAWQYAREAACLEDDDWCGVADKSQQELEALLADTDEDDVPMLYNLGSSWATWLEANSADWNAVAQLGRINLIMHRVVELDEQHEQGSAHLYLGVLATLIPEALGGKPEEGRKHYERAIELSKGQNLMAKVLFAERYARLVFDRELHDQLLNEVLAADSHVTGLTLSNTLAQAKAKTLLASAPDYF